MYSKKASMSPMVNAQMDQQMGDGQEMDKEENFKKLFSAMAFKTFTGKFSELMDKIKDFKVLSSNIDKGAGVGAFAIGIPNSEDVIVIPIILDNNEIQPIMFMYLQKMGVFLPLNKEWLTEIFKRAEETTGSIERPNISMLQANNNITQLTNLPRYHGLSNLVGKVASENTTLAPIFTSVLKEIPDTSKKAFITFLEKNEKVASELFQSYGFENIKDALTLDKATVKVSEETMSPKVEDDIVVVTPGTPLDIIKKEFGKEHVIMDDIVNKGFSIKDKRETKNKMVIFTDYVNRLENPTEPGAYEIYLSNGDVVPALILCDPIMIDTSDCVSCSDWDKKQFKSYQVIAKNYVMVLFGNGDYSVTKADNIMSTPTLAESIENSMVYNHIYGDATSEIPTGKPFLFAKRTGNSYITTGPIKVSQKTKEKDGDITCVTESGSTIIFTSKYKGKSIYVTKDNTIFVPDTFKVIPLKDEINKNKIVGSMKTIISFTNYRLLERGAKPVTIVKDKNSEYGIETNRPIRKLAALVKTAREYDVSAKDVEFAMDKMEKEGLNVLTTYVLPKEIKIASLFEKQAQGEMTPQMMAQMQQMMAQQGQGQPQMDPQMMAQMQQMMMAQQGGQGQPQMDPQMMAQQQGQGQGQPQQPMDPQMMAQMQQMMQGGMDASGQMGGMPELVDAGALLSLSYVSKIEEILPKYVPNLMTALDNIARLLLNLWMNSSDIQQELGFVEYQNLELKLRMIFNNLGDLLLSLNKKVNILDQ